VTWLDQTKPSQKSSHRPSQAKNQAKLSKKTSKSKPSHQLFFGFQAKPQKFAGLPRSAIGGVIWKKFNFQTFGKSNIPKKMGFNFRDLSWGVKWSITVFD
jgi:hypothetical protein